MMVRTQISLSEKDHRRAKRRAAELGVSLAEYVRSAVARDLGAGDSPTDVSALFALGASGRSDVSASKHAHVAEAVAARRAGDRR